MPKPIERRELVTAVQRVLSDEHLQEKRERRKEHLRLRLPGHDTDGATITVLVVDDNVDAATATAMLLRMEKLQASMAHDGAQALAIAAEEEPDAVLLDIGLPDIDGFTVAKRLRDGGYSGLIVALSGRDEGEEKQRLRAAGFDVHVAKPADPDALVRLIRDGCRGADRS